MITAYTKETLFKHFSSNAICDSLTFESKQSFKRILENALFKSVLGDEELIATAELFFDNDLNVTKTSRNGFMHRNTLLYRIEKINRLVGLNLKRFDDAVVFHNILLISKLINA